MRSAAFLVAATLSVSTDAFVAPAVPTTYRRGDVCMNAHGSRKAFVEQGAVALAGLAGFAQAANAAKYFGDKTDYPEVVKPGDAVKDEGKLKELSGQVETIRKYQAAVRDLQAELSSNAQADLRPKLRKSFEFSKLRTTLNEANSVFDEDSQRGTDRLIRAILQDAVEFDDASRTKPGIERSARRVGIMQQKLAKLDKAFTDLLAFF